MTDIPIKAIEISEAPQKYQRCLRKTDKNFNGYIEKEEAEKALEGILANLPIDEILNEEAQKLLRRFIDSTSSEKSQFNTIIDQDETIKAKNLLIKHFGAMKVLSWLLLQDPQNYFIKDFTPDSLKFKHQTKINIAGKWVSSWKKTGLNAGAFQNGIKITGTLESDCENYTWITNQKIPQGEKYLAINVSYSAEKGSWGERCMFALQINGQFVRPINLSSQPDGFMNRHSGTLYFSIDDFDSIDTVSVKTFAGKNINLELKNIRVYSAENRIKAPSIKLSCHINQAGYPALSKKTAVLAFSAKKDQLEPIKFYIREKQGEKIVFNGSSSSFSFFAPSGETYATLDFSPFQKEGKYFVVIPKQTGINEEVASFDFPIAKDVQSIYRPLRDAALKAYSYWQCGDQSVYKCHRQDKSAEIFEEQGKTKDVSGGWHDAGDYGKYSVNAAYTLGMLMLGKEAFPSAFANLKLEDTIRPEIEWLLKMQRKDGAVYHKACSKEWPLNEVPPDGDMYTKFVVPVSTTATGGFAAVMARASRVFAKSDPALAKKCLAAAKQAWSFLEKHPNIIMTKESYGGKEYGGPYTDTDDRDERLWAAAELRLNSYVQARIPFDLSKEKTWDWQNVNFFAFYSYGLGKKEFQPLKTYGDYLVGLQEKTPYGISITGLAPGAFDWGSNGVVATGAFQLLLTSKITGNPKYRGKAAESLNYLLGLNPLDKSFITGFGKNPPKDPHFRPSMSGFHPLPKGLLAGGPNNVNIGGDVPLAAIWNKPPYLRYVDDHWSWATNEVAINWNAPLVNLLAVLVSP